MAVARQTGRVTEVAGLTTDRRLVTADPTSGRFTDTINIGPVRAKVNGTWVPLDQTLQATADRVEPRASSLGLSISDGGDADLVRLTDAGRSFAVRWPTPLPAPVLRGDSAVFADVRPGIDLVVTARATGFGEFLVVRDREAATDPWLRRVELGVDAPGQRLRRDGDTLKAYDASGALAFISEPVRMWASGPQAEGSAVGDQVEASVAATRSASGGRSAAIDFRVSADRVSLVPDRSMLVDPHTRFPVVIDPSVSGSRVRFASVDSSGKKGVYGSTNTESQWIGLKPIKGATYGGLVSRISYGFTVPADLSKSGVKILSAKFRHLQTWSPQSGADCTKQYATPHINLWETNDFSDNFDWGHQPDTSRKLSDSEFVVGDVDKCKAAGYSNHAATQEWDALAGVLAHVAARQNYLSLRVNEVSDNNDDPSASVRASGTRYYQNDVNVPALVIEYNGAPAAPTAPTASPSVAYAGETYVSSTSPVLATTVKDENTTQDLTTTFSLTPTGGSATAYQTTVRQPGPDGARAATSPGQVGVADESRYTVSAKANDGIVDSAVGPSSTFVVDTTPPALPVVSGGPSGTVTAGTTLSFTADAPEADVASYAFGLSTDNPTTRITPSALGGPVTITVTPRQFGPNYLAVRSYDRAGNTSSTVAKVAFKVDGTLPSNHYRLDYSGADERTGTAPGSTAKNIAIPSATFVNGRDRYAADGATTQDCKDRALSVSSSTAVHNVTSDPPYPLDTTQAVTLSAWVNPTGTAGASTGSGDEAYAVSMPASATQTALALGYRKDPSTGQVYWLFSMTTAAGRVLVEDPANRAAASVTPGQWTHLSGVFDPVSGTATLYVNATPVGQRTGVAGTPLKATQLEFGSGPLGTADLQWTGAVDEVLLYQGALPLGSINQQRNDRRPPVAC